VPTLRTGGAKPPLPHTSSWRGTYLSTGTTFPFRLYFWYICFSYKNRFRFIQVLLWKQWSECNRYIKLVIGCKQTQAASAVLAPFIGYDEAGSDKEQASDVSAGRPSVSLSHSLSLALCYRRHPDAATRRKWIRSWACHLFRPSSPPQTRRSPAGYAAGCDGIPFLILTLSRGGVLEFRFQNRCRTFSEMNEK